MELKKSIIDDEFDDEAEARERYPFLYGDDEQAEPAENGRDPLQRPLESFGVAANSNPRELPNYHYLDSLSEEHLPHLDFHRSDNFFGAKPAHRFFKGGDKIGKTSRRLFGDYWHEGELAILFSDVGGGKSVLAAQIAQAIASGIPVKGVGSDVEAQRVAFFDLELSDEQFDFRYSNSDRDSPAKFPFHRNFIRSTPSRKAVMPEWAINESHFILNSIVCFLEFSKARVAIIDNISWLNTGRFGISEPRFLRALSRIRRDNGLSILVLAHTPKTRFRLPLSVGDLRGSKMIASFADSIFALGGSRLGPDVRYLKTIKKRNIPAEDSNRVDTFRIRKDVCFLNMRYEGISDERDHIGWITNKMERETYAVMEKLAVMEEEGVPQREMAEKLGISQTTVCRYLRSIRKHDE